MREFADEYFFNPASVRWYWGMYLASQEDGSNPLASPLRARDLSGLPPATVITAEYDPLRDEAEQYAGELQAAGVPVRIIRYDGMMHGFFTMVGTLDTARAAVLEAAARLREAFAALPGTGPVASLNQPLRARVPGRDDRVFVFEAQGAHRPRIEAEQPSVRRRQSQPPSGQHAQHVAVRHQDHVAVDEVRQRPCDHPVGTSADLVDRLTGMRGVPGDDAVPPQVPPRPLTLDLRRRHPLVAAVVPLPQVGVLLAARDPGEFRGLHGAGRRAAERRDDRATRQHRAKLYRVGYAARGERDVGAPGVLAGRAPFGLPVPQQDQVSHRPNDGRLLCSSDDRARRPPTTSAAQHPIQVVYRDAAAIDGYAVAVGVGAVCCLAALVLLPVLARRPRTQSSRRT
jgi:hypothetical protein